MNKFYATNNKKLFLDNSIKQSNVLRNDYKNRAILEIISEMNLNEEPKWIDSKIFKDYYVKTMIQLKIKILLIYLYPLTKMLI